MDVSFGISTQFFRRHELNVDRLESLRKAGYRHIELFCNRPHFAYDDPRLRSGIVGWFRDHALPAPSLHLPFFEQVGPTDRRWFSAVDPEPRVREEAIDELKRSLEIAEHLRIAYAVLHLGNPGDPFHPVHFDYAYAALETVRAFSGVQVLIENIPNEISRLDRIQEWMEVAKVADVGICYDSGHGNIQDENGPLANILATHLHDNDGERDQHLWPFEGTINWPQLVDRLISARYEGTLLFETRLQDGIGLEHGNHVQERMVELWEEASQSIDEFRAKHKLKRDGEER